MPTVAVVHDYLNQRGGAERVALELARLWPDAPIYTSLYRPDSTFPELRERDVRVSWLDRAPVDAGFRRLLPLYPAAFRGLGVLDHDVVVSSSSGWAHGVRTAEGTVHVVYCHTPARWLYRPGEHLGASSFQRRLAAPLLGPMRAWDRRAAARADVYVANSENVRRRIVATYGRDAEVVPPPVDVDRFRPRPRGERLLVVSRLLPYKHVDAAIRAADRAGLGLDVVGSGPAYDDLRRLAGPGVAFHPALDDAAVTALMETCRALLLPGEEDFGIAPVEAQAAGKPVVALAAGGALETVVEGVTGVFFRDHDPGAIAAAVRAADALGTPPEEIAWHARRFSREAFAERMRAVVARALAMRGSRPAAEGKN
jgi:glycosyltransferase involved in cell wall biosynthesis